ncbi:MAG: MltA domain-containing protein [Planctomycetota bacterium]|nr:MltA domain-containing protein [Planctomycetota bacterium]
MNTTTLTRSLLLPCLLIAGCFGAPKEPEYGRPLPRGAQVLMPVSTDELPGFGHEWAMRHELLPALEQSLAWMRRPNARTFYPQAGISYERSLASLVRMHEVLTTAVDRREFEERVRSEFVAYRSAGWDGRGGGVLFTAYCTPILDGSPVETAVYRYPLYALPDDLVKGPGGAILGQRIFDGTTKPYPTRRAIEAGALLANKELELVWLRDAVSAYIAHVNGSAFVSMTDGSMLRLGYAGKNGRDYTSLGGELIADGMMDEDQVSLAAIRRWAKENPVRARDYMQRNESFVFFTPIFDNPHGSLDVPVSGGRSLATDKRLFPRGALTFVDTVFPVPGTRATRPFQQFLLDQDTGGAIRTAGRADIYLGIGPRAEQQAGATKAPGQLYYLFIKE